MGVRYRWLLVASTLCVFAAQGCDMNPQPEVPSDDETTDYGYDGGAAIPVPGADWGDAGTGDDLQNGKTASGSDRQDPSQDSNYSGFDDPSGPPGTGEAPRPEDDAGRWEEVDAGSDVPDGNGGVVAL